ncbi:SAV_6107 family HEPN domain-containing protein [Amycolatopsis sp. GM8]|uniref:SAV_6107 family HEPN domain-containing protein n=1 Tax=Amycolatopsis sp. GM8 TaxID=2896530 RepID=UPI001EEDA40F|nr:SAV_6107 family HEPN domain-containing protein [Amycolatopsis sp. GM8]
MSVATVASHTEPEQPRLPLPERPPVAPAAVSLLNEARHGLAEAEQAADPVTKFITSYLAALRAGAAVLAARGRPHRGRARPASVWVLLETAAPELAEWSSYFAANSAARAAAQAGITRRITERSAAQLCQQAGRFVELAGRVVHPRGDTARPARAKVQRR